VNGHAIECSEKSSTVRLIAVLSAFSRAQATFAMQISVASHVFPYKLNGGKAEMSHASWWRRLELSDMSLFEPPATSFSASAETGTHF
jgi:hypothetical protein